MSEFVDEITPEMTGTWLVTTQGSEHLWNLDDKTYIRKNVSGDNPFGFDNEVKSLERVLFWPKVDHVFAVVNPDGHSFHRSSTIKTIERVEKA